jgi:hypothetical protein
MQDKDGIEQHWKLESMAKYALIGAVIGLVLISIFLMGVKHADPSWPKYWQLKPLVIVPLAGAAGGAFFYFLNNFNLNGFWLKLAARIVGLICFIIALWLGTVLGLDGTLWD